jgi:two-component system response regulator
MTNEVEILLVEDDEADAELTLLALKQNGLANMIHTVRDGAEALDFLFCRGQYASREFGRQPKVVLLDIKLPKMDGIEVLRAVKQDPRTRTIPVVILTSSPEDQDRINGYNLGANSYLHKPVSFEQFRETVKQIGLYWMVVNVPPPGGAGD